MAQLVTVSPGCPLKPRGCLPPVGPGVLLAPKRRHQVQRQMETGAQVPLSLVPTPAAGGHLVPVEGQGAAQEAGHHGHAVLGGQDIHAMLGGLQHVLLAGLLQPGTQHTHDLGHLRAVGTGQTWKQASQEPGAVYMGPWGGVGSPGAAGPLMGLGPRREPGALWICVEH